MIEHSTSTTFFHKGIECKKIDTTTEKDFIPTSRKITFLVSDESFRYAISKLISNKMSNI